MDKSTDSIVIPVDSEHGGIRFAVVIIFLVGWVLGYLVISAVVSSAGLNIIALIGGFFIAYGLTALIERYLKQRWPSGRAIHIDDASVQTVLRGTPQQTITIDGHEVDLLRWRFQTRRRSRVPKGWYVLACALEHEDTYLSAYTFMSPDQLGNFAAADHFTELIRREEPKPGSRSGAGRGGDMLLAGAQRRLHQAEQQRWLDGAEMTASDFETYVTTIEQQFPGLRT
jgi:hypothetical protein